MFRSRYGLMLLVAATVLVVVPWMTYVLHGGEQIVFIAGVALILSVTTAVAVGPVRHVWSRFRRFLTEAWLRRVSRSTLGMMFLVAMATVTLALFRYALDYGDHGEFVIGTAVTLVVVFGVLVCVRGRVRTFCAGFLGGALLYVALCTASIFWYERDQSRSQFELVPTTELYRWVFNALDPDPSFDPNDKKLFLRAAHSLTALAIGAYGGAAALVIMRRRLNHVQAIEAGADTLIAAGAQDEPIKVWQNPSEDHMDPTR